MPTYTPTYKLRQPADQELVSYGAATITENADKLEAALLDAKWYKGNLTTGTDLNTVRTPGSYRIPTYAVATSLLNPPPEINTGSLEVIPLTTSTVMQRLSLSAGYSGSRSFIRTGGTSWSEWEASTRIQTPLKSGDDLDDYTAPGIYGAATSTLAESIANLGESSACLVIVDKIATSSYWTVFQTVQTEDVIKRRILRSTGVHSEWSRIWPAPAGSAAGAGRSWGRPAARLRKLGGYGTGGRPVVALTLDHGLDNLTEHIADYASNRGVPYTIAVSTAEVGSGENSNVDWSALQTLALAGGVELANHGPSHSDQTGVEAITAAVVGSRDLMLANMPQVAVDTFIMPGHGVADGWDGLGLAQTLEAVNGTFAGQLIQQTHGVFTGDVPGSLWPMTGDLPAGVDRIGIDTGSWITTAQERIELAARLGGYALLTIGHPSLWGQDGRTTVAQIRAFIDWLAARRDDGTIVLGTVAGAAFARAHDEHVPRLDDPTAWTEGTQQIDLTLTPSARGGVFQVDAPGATAITVTDDTGALSTTVAGQHRPFTIPASATTLTVTTTAATSTPTVRPI